MDNDSISIKHVPTAETAVDGERQWAIYRCGHGCYHVALDRVMVTFTQDEFRALQSLMRRASERFHMMPPAPARHSH